MGGAYSTYWEWRGAYRVLVGEHEEKRPLGKHRCRWEGNTRGADKSLVRTTSRCRRTESIVSLERGVCSCTEMQVFSCDRGWKEACQGRARFQQHGDASSHQVFFPARQSAEENSRHSDRNIRGSCTIVRHRLKMGCPVQTWRFFHPWCASSWTTQNSDHPGDYS